MTAAGVACSLTPCVTLRHAFSACVRHRVWVRARRALASIHSCTFQGTLVVMTDDSRCRRLSGDSSYSAFPRGGAGTGGEPERTVGGFGRPLRGGGVRCTMEPNPHAQVIQRVGFCCVLGALEGDHTTGGKPAQTQRENVHILDTNASSSACIRYHLIKREHINTSMNRSPHNPHAQGTQSHAHPFTRQQVLQRAFGRAGPRPRPS